jgi:NitT/TauT family transport system permease protein
LAVGKVTKFVSRTPIVFSLLVWAVEGVVIGQLLIAIMGVGELFKLYSRNFLFKEFWALLLMVFAFAFATSELVGYVERRIGYDARAR